jgi:predicted nucleotidyltransferase
MPIRDLNRQPLPIALPREQIGEFCTKWGIEEFALFGSVLREDFDRDSDVDVLISLKRRVQHGLIDWVKMRDELQGILGREVDLISREGVEVSRDAYRRREILNSAEVVHVQG